MLSKRAKNTLNKLAENAKGHPRILSRDAVGRYFRADGVEVKPSGALFELIETGVLKPSGDALFPDMTPQTYRLDLNAAMG